ncbi:Triose-phosphate Transporter [Phlyctochytrium bullatum]|nr:Triose-phosphate Transporter [Phlyctochytrium bullatum]
MAQAILPFRHRLHRIIARLPAPGKTLRVLLYAGLWYFFSAILSIVNKAMIGKEQYNFNYPYSVSAVHALIQYALTAGIVALPSGARRPPPSPSKLSHILPTCLFSALDIGLSIASLHHISLTFYTIAKSAVPVWVLLFAFLLRLERPTPALVAVILLICAGVAVTAAGELRFSPVGCAMVVGAGVASGARWCLTQVVMERGGGAVGQGPLEAILRLSPGQFWMLAGVAGAVEGWGEGAVWRSEHWSTWDRGVRTAGLVAAGGVVALLMTMSQFALVNATGVVTLSVTGIFKSIFMIVVGALVFGDTTTPLGCVGVVVSTLGVAAYTAIRVGGTGRRLKRSRSDETTDPHGWRGEASDGEHAEEGSPTPASEHVEAMGPSHAGEQDGSVQDDPKESQHSEDLGAGASHSREHAEDTAASHAGKPDETTDCDGDRVEFETEHVALYSDEPNVPKEVELAFIEREFRARVRSEARMCAKDQQLPDHKTCTAFENVKAGGTRAVPYYLAVFKTFVWSSRNTHDNISKDIRSIK